MSNKIIDEQIKRLQSKKHVNTVRANAKKHCYDTLFFTYEANYTHRVHFSYLADEAHYYSYAILCKEDKWLSSEESEDGKGYPLDIIELLDEEDDFMNWEEAVRDMCPECKKYLSLSQVVADSAKVLRLRGDNKLQHAKTIKEDLYQDATRLDGVVIAKEANK